jgi:hypothetical protein
VKRHVGGTESFDRPGVRNYSALRNGSTLRKDDAWKMNAALGVKTGGNHVLVGSLNIIGCALIQGRLLSQASVIGGCYGLNLKQTNACTYSTSTASLLISKPNSGSIKKSSHSFRPVSISSATSVTKQSNSRLPSEGLKLSLAGGRTVTVPWIWLRDHCRCKVCYNSATFQKNVDNYSLQNLGAESVETSGDKLTITCKANIVLILSLLVTCIG